MSYTGPLIGGSTRKGWKELEEGTKNNLLFIPGLAEPNFGFIWDIAIENSLIFACSASIPPLSAALQFSPFGEARSLPLSAQKAGWE